MSAGKRILRAFAWFLLLCTLLLIAFFLYVRSVALADPPEVPDTPLLREPIMQPDSGLYTLGHNWIRKSESGLYEMYVEGTPYERGVAIGRLSQSLVHYQEEVFNRQIHRLVPSNFYLGILKYFVGWFNRHLADHVPLEFKQEIYGVSRSASHEFDDIAPAYHRILNYHGAHDIGHALQNMSLVGCSSFASWDAASEDSSLIIGRNFDFYVGDDFARNKIIAFYKPDKGHRFMMVTFGGMTGVLSGMNDQGLTVTINAAKSEIPSGAATPVSIVAREILQYAATIEQAYEIAARRKMFVSESFMIGCASAGRAALIEKSPEQTLIYDAQGDRLVSTNHFQSRELGNTHVNQAFMQSSSSAYRYKRILQLLAADTSNSVLKTAAILRNSLGLNDTDIGYGNEKAINQQIAHHGVIFQPQKRLVWVSAAPWQLGKFVCYDLDKVFGRQMHSNVEIYEKSAEIPADPFVGSQAYWDYLKFSPFRFPFTPGLEAAPDSLLKWNPHSYQAYLLAGDLLLEQKQFARAAELYKKGLRLEIATTQERMHMQEQLDICRKKLE